MKENNYFAYVLLGFRDDQVESLCCMKAISDVLKTAARHLWAYRRYWLVSLAITLLIIGGLLIFADEQASTPFIYFD